ncbi:hypothetical protein CO712_20925 [Burkholderia gladioli pv. gladioli]|nr:hypothetical protein CO712_20925 [Burkholderia gladioli pv. gladioli]
MCSDFTGLNVTAPYMSKSFVRVAFGGKFVEKIGTATGAVNSPEPYVITTVTVGLLRTQSLSNAWMLQAQTSGNIGSVTIHSDTSAFDPIALTNTTIADIDPGAFDGTDPVVRLTLEGIFYINNNLWSYA